MNKTNQSNLQTAEEITFDELVFIFKQVSLYNLSECEFVQENSDKDEMAINAIDKKGDVVDAIIYDGNIFYMMNNDDSFDKLNPMKSAYAALHSYRKQGVGEGESEGSYYYPLFKFFSDQHDLTLVDSEIQDIISVVESFNNSNK